MAVDFLEILERADYGYSMDKEAWDLNKIALPTQDLVRKYQLAWDKNTIVPADHGLADGVFQAGLELASQAGVYLLHSRKVLQFDRAELELGLREMPQALNMGEGVDVRTLYARQVMDTRPPLIWAG